MSSSPLPLMAKFMMETMRFHLGTQTMLDKCVRDDSGHMVLKSDPERT